MGYVSLPEGMGIISWQAMEISGSNLNDTQDDSWEPWKMDVESLRDTFFFSKSRLPGLCFN